METVVADYQQKLEGVGNKNDVGPKGVWSLELPVFSFSYDLSVSMV